MILQGILGNVAFTTTATLPTGILTAPTPQYNTYDYPAGYVLGVMQVAVMMYLHRNCNV